MPQSDFLPLVITSPVDYQIIQRDGTSADIAIVGAFAASGSHDVEARFNGGSWQTIATNSTGQFSGTLTGQSQGNGALEVRLVDNTSITNTVDNVGIGDIFVIAGQSNASGYGGAPDNVATHATLISGVFTNGYFWGAMRDRTDRNTLQVDSVSDDAGASEAGGSYWPILGTLLMDTVGIPFGFVPCSLGGTSINDWQPGADHQDRTTLYGSMIYRALQVGGIKAVLWHQGESNAIAQTSSAEYNALLDALAGAINSDLGVPLVAAKIHKWDDLYSVTQDDVDTINSAIDTAWSDNSNVLAGPNFDSPTRVSSSLHFGTADEMAEAAGRWSAALQTAFYP